VKMPRGLQSCSKSTTSNLPSLSKSLHADSSDSNGDADSLLKEGKKTKERRPMPMNQLKRKQEKAKKAIKMLS